MAKDLVCGMQVDENNPQTPRLEHKGNLYYFCTPLCRAQFEAEPERFLGESGEEQSKRTHKGSGNPDAG